PGARRGPPQGHPQRGGLAARLEAARRVRRSREPHVRARPRRRSGPRETLNTLRHPWVAAAVAVVAVAATGSSSAHHHVRQWERSITEWLNGAPDWVAHAMWPIMQ